MEENLTIYVYVIPSLINTLIFGCLLPTYRKEPERSW